MNVIDVLKRQYRPSEQKMRNVIQERWGEYDKEYVNRTKEVITKLGQYHAESVWKEGYKPQNAMLIEQDWNYSCMKGIGVASDAERTDTINQRIYPLIEELDFLMKRLKNIENKWWYKFFRFWDKK